MSSIVGHSGVSPRAKWMSLILFVIQNTVLTIALRACSLYESAHNSSYIASTVVMFTEVLKLVLSTIMCFVVDAQSNPYTFRDLLVRGYVDDGADFLKLCVPAILYTIQNNLQYVIESAPLFLVLYQSKIITTAIFYSVLLSRRLGMREWACVVLLAIGVSMVESSQHEISPHHASNVIGVISVVTACITSGFAGVYFEKILKSSRSSIWMINMQMSMLSSFFCVSLSLTQDTEEIIEFGLWKGYNMYVVLIIILQAITGLVVALVVKYSDNIHKGFGYAASIIISNTIDAYLFNDTTINTTYTTGSLVVIVTTWYFFSSSTGSTTGSSVVTSSSSSSALNEIDDVSSSKVGDEESSEEEDSNRKNDFYSRWIGGHAPTK